MIKSFIRKKLYKLYQNFKEQDALLSKELRKQNLKQQASIGQDTRFADNAVIQNGQDDKSKIKIGKFTLIHGHLIVFKHGGEIQIGDHCYIGDNTKIWSAKKIQIGHRVLISHNVNIHDNNSHPLNSIERHKDFVHIFNIGFQDNVSLNEKEIIIGDDVWIGFNCTILKGVTIGKGAIIGACSIVKEDVPPYAVVVGNPSEIVKYVN